MVLVEEYPKFVGEQKGNIVAYIGHGSLPK